MLAWKYDTLATIIRDGSAQSFDLALKKERHFVTNASGGSKHTRKRPDAESSVLVHKALAVDTAFSAIAMVLDNGALRIDGVLRTGQHIDTSSTPFMYESRTFFHRQAFIYVACGGDSVHAITARGQLWAMGNNMEGQLGLGHYQSVKSPTMVSQAFFSGERVAYVAAGPFHTVVTTSEGHVFSYGHASLGRLGRPMEDHTCTPQQVRFGDAGQYRIVQVECGKWHCLALSTCGLVFSWGGGGTGALGLGKLCLNQYFPSIVGGPDVFGGSLVWTLSCGQSHSLFLTVDKRVWSCGRGFTGRLGHATCQDCYVPTLVLRLPDTIVFVRAGEMQSAVVDESGSVFVWGGVGSQRLCQTCDKFVMVPSKVMSSAFTSADFPKVGRWHEPAPYLFLLFYMSTMPSYGANMLAPAARRSARIQGRRSSFFLGACNTLLLSTDVCKIIWRMCQWTSTNVSPDFKALRRVLCIDGL